MNRAAAISPLSEAFVAVRAWLDQGPDVATELPRTMADEVAEMFDLDPFSRNIMLLCAYANLEPEAQSTIAKLLGDPMVGQPTLGLALARLPGAHWAAMGADAPLRRAGLVRAEGHGAVVSRRLRLADPVLFWMLGAPTLDETTAQVLRRLDPTTDIAPNRVTLARAIATRFRIPQNPVLHLIGPDPDGKLAAFSMACAASGQAAYALSAYLLPGATSDLPAFCTDLARDMTLLDARVILICDDTADPRIAQLFAETYRGPLAIASTEALRVGHRMALRLEMPLLRATEQLLVWQTALGALSQKMNGTLPHMAATFRVAPEIANTIARELEMYDDAGGKTSESTFAEWAWSACRRAARPRMDDLAQRIDAPVTWDDLVLPERQKEVLANIVAQARNRVQVYEDWGFAARLQNKGLGVSALFSGPSGAGKSMAGEVIGNALNLDVYRVDLSALVSKWVGETEKNLRRVFDAAEDGGVILQFDEADALFGRRSEVKDSHDRHANIEVSYLLQRLEAYRGLCILTSNMRDNIDEAFLRRIRFVVEFRFPNRSERQEIWQRMFPQQVPLETLDYDRLSQLNVAGGSIRNIALAASFLAADRGSPVSMTELLQAARLEYDKDGRSMTDAEQAGWLR
jgi:hypothetical protein